MGSNPISSGTEVERAGEITYRKNLLVESSPPEDRIALLSESIAESPLFLFGRPIFFL